MNASGSLLAAFVTPSIFFGGAAAMSLPVLIHLFARRRFRRIRWAAIEFLLQAQRANRRRIRIEELILLALRCLAVLLIGLFVARPFLTAWAGLGWLPFEGGRTDRVIVIDDSFSMGYTSGGESSFERAKAATKRLIELFSESSIGGPQDTVTVVRACGAGAFGEESGTVGGAGGGNVGDRGAASNSMFATVGRQEEMADLSSRVEGMRASQRALDLPETVRKVRRVLDEQTDALNAAVYFVSDFQRRDWVQNESPGGDAAGAGGADASGEANPKSVLAPLADWRRGNSSEGKLQLALIDVGDDGAENTSVASLVCGQQRIVAGAEAPVDATISNYSNRAIGPLNLDVHLDLTPLAGVSSGTIPAHETVRVPVLVSAVRAGWQSILVSSPEDRLPLDDERYLAVEVVSARNVLIVDGEPSTDAYMDEAAVLRTALRPAGDVFSGNDVMVIDETELEGTTLNDYDVVILANVYRISDGMAGRLSRFVADGGGLAIMVGDQVDVESYNDVLSAGGTGLLPCELGDRRTGGVAGARMVVDDALHPMVRVLGGNDNAFAGSIAFEQYLGCTPVETSASPSGESNGEGSADKTPKAGPARVIAHFNDPEGTPAIVERSFGNGRVIVYGSTCDQEWNDWAKDPSYVVSMLEMVRYLGRGSGAGSEFTVGSPIAFSIDPSAYRQEVTVRTPGFPTEPETRLSATPAKDGRGFTVAWDRTDSVGVYRFVLTNQFGEEEIRTVAVNVDASESDLAGTDEAELRDRLADASFEYIDGLDALRQLSEHGRRELWRPVLVAALMILVGEQFLAWWFGRRS